VPRTLRGMDLFLTGVIAALLGFAAGVLLMQGRLSGLAESVRAVAQQNRRWDEWLLDTNRRGALAEQQAENLLRAAGLQPDIDYIRQKALPAGIQPDLTIRLPLGRVVHVDAKFPLPAYRRYAETGGQRERAEFVRAVARHVEQIAARGYADDPEGVGFVLLYLPYDQALELLADGRGGLEPAVDRADVVLCSPATLRPLLGIIRRAIGVIMIERNTSEIVAVLAQVQHRWDEFVAAGGGLDTLARHLVNAHNVFFGEVARRRGEISRQLAEIEHLRRPQPLLESEWDP
jgi:DNA anti-recombination protein RmuC